MNSAETIARALDKNFRSSGDGYVCRCPAHNDDKPSLKISTGKDDKILVHCHAGCDPQAVIGEIKSRGLWPEAPAPEPRRQRARIAKTYDYFDHQTGELLMQVCRMEPKSFRQRRPDPVRPGEWLWSVGPEHRTLYNAVRAFKHDKIVFVVEGEKDVDNLAELGIVAVCNPGGAGKWQDSYSEILRGKDVIIVPDNDKAGRDHADIVGAALRPVAGRVRVLSLPDLPDKGDVSDWIAAGGTRGRLSELAKQATEWTPQQAPEPSVPDAPVDTGAPFIPLGYNKGTYYYLSRGTQQITELTCGGHTKANLLGLAPLKHWEIAYPGARGMNVDLAADELMRACEAAGIFSKELLRGRGAWWDDGRIVLHCGDRLYVDKTPVAPSGIASRFVYEVGLPMRADIDHPLTVDESRKFLDLVRMMPFGRDIDALYLAGWCALAHIGGVLPWRPHVWVVGSKGSGKSHVMSAVVKPILGDSCLFVASETTEAGIRQSLGCDAIPVLFDEAEGEDYRAHERLQRILALVRQSSSETGAKLVKGTTGGDAMSFQIRSCFAFSSINANLVQQSDKSRVTLVELKKDSQQVNFEDIVAAEARLLTERYISRFHARSITLAAVIRENARVFAKAVAQVMNEQRAGDQLGTLLAGAYSLTSDDVILFEDAAKWVASVDWSEDREEIAGMSDEQSLLSYIMQQKVRVILAEKQRDLTVGELVMMAQPNGTDILVSPLESDDARAALGRVGIRASATGLYVANVSDGLSKLMRGSTWPVNWNKVVKRLPGAHVAGKTYFGFRGSESNATFLPNAVFRGDCR